MNNWNERMACMKALTNHPLHLKRMDELDAARTEYLDTRDVRVLLRLERIERSLLGPYILPLSTREREQLIEVGLVDVPPWEMTP